MTGEQESIVAMTESWSIHNLPEELWLEILSRLAVKSLLRFRCVSRSWKLFIDDPKFSRLHLTNFNNSREPNLFLIIKSSECVVKSHETFATISSLAFLQSNLDSVHVLRTTPLPARTVRQWFLVSSIDGLFLLRSTVTLSLMLWNPSIQKTLVLPPCPDLSQAFEIGLGFDPVVNDYKFVRFLVIPTRGIQFVAIYTLETNSWKTVEYQGEGRLDRLLLHYQTSISFNGAVYALARDRFLSSDQLISFDLRTESSASLKLPVSDGSEECNHALTLVDDGCSLAVVNLSESKGSVWVLKRVGDDSKAWSWTQLWTFPTAAKYEFIRLKKNGEMLMKWEDKVICYDLETKQEKIVVEKIEEKIHMGATVAYMESLILLN